MDTDANITSPFMTLCVVLGLWSKATIDLQIFYSLTVLLIVYTCALQLEAFKLLNVSVGLISISGMVVYPKNNSL